MKVVIYYLFGQTAKASWKREAQTTLNFHFLEDLNNFLGGPSILG